MRRDPTGACFIRLERRSSRRAIVLEEFGGLDSLVYKDIPGPESKSGHVVIQVKAFGLNHAELHMRKGEWAEIAGEGEAVPRLPLR